MRDRFSHIFEMGPKSAHFIWIEARESTQKTIDVNAVPLDGGRGCERAEPAAEL